MQDINYNDNNRICIKKDNFENIILDINNKEKKYTFSDLNEYILFLKIVIGEDDKELIKKVKVIKNKYKEKNLRFDIDVYRNDLSKIDIKRYKAIKYYSDTSEKIKCYIKKNQENLINFDKNLLICKLKYELSIVNLEDGNEYDTINNILDELKVDEELVNRVIYRKTKCIEYFRNLYKSFSVEKNNKSNSKLKLKNLFLILGGSISLLGLSFLLLPTIFGISVLGPVSGGLFAYLQSIVQSISMTGVSVIIGSCLISGASLIVLPGLSITYNDILKSKELYIEIQKYINYINIKDSTKKIINGHLDEDIIYDIIEKVKNSNT